MIRFIILSKLIKLQVTQIKNQQERDMQNKSLSNVGEVQKGGLSRANKKGGIKNATEARTQLKRIMVHVEEMLEGQRELIKDKSQHDQLFFQDLLSQLKKAEVLASLEVPLSTLQIRLFISWNLTALYTRSQQTSYSIMTSKKIISILNDLIKQNRYHHLLPHNYLCEDSSFYKCVGNRAFFNLLRGRAYLALCMSRSKESAHDEALKAATSAQIMIVEAIHELLVIFLNQLLKFMFKHNYCLKVKNQQKKHKNSTKSQTVLSVEYENYRACINPLIEICRSEFKCLPSSIKIANKFITLNKSIRDQIELISKYTYYQFKDICEHQQVIGLDIKRKIFLDAVSIDLTPYSELEEEKISVDIDWIHRTTFYLTSCYYCLSAESNYISKQIDVIFDNQISLSEHWLSKSLELSTLYLSGSTLHKQVKALFQNLHSVDRVAIKEEEEQELPAIQKKNQKVQVKNIQISTLKSKELAPIVIRKLKAENDEEKRHLMRSLQIPENRFYGKKIHFSKQKEKTIKQMRKVYRQNISEHASPNDLEKSIERRDLQTALIQKHSKKGNPYTCFNFSKTIEKSIPGVSNIQF